jgi:hypothetical protein
MPSPSGYTNPNAKGNKSAAKPKAKMNPRSTERTARSVSATTKSKPVKSTIKVSQSTIDLIKKMGMTKALQEVKAYGQQARMKPGNKEYETMREGGRGLLKEEFATGVKRLYGERRFGEAAGASGSSKPKKASTKYSPAPYKKPKPKTGGSSTSKMK